MCGDTSTFRLERVERLATRKQSRKGEDMPKRSSQDRNEGAMDKAKGRLKEAGGSLTGNKDKKAEGRTDQDKGTLKKKKGAAKDLLK